MGDPVLRDPALVADDVRNGLVSRAAARDLHKVVLAADGAPDLQATTALRADRG